MHCHHLETEWEAAGARRPCLLKEHSTFEQETTWTPSQFGDGYDCNVMSGRREQRQLNVQRSAIRRSSAAAGLVAVLAASLAPGACGFTNLSPSTPFHLQNFWGNAVTRLCSVGCPRSKVASSIQMASARPIRDDADKQVRGRGMKRGRGMSNSEPSARIVRDVSLDSEEDEEEEEYVGSWGGVGTNSKRFVADDDWAMWLNHGFPDMLKVAFVAPLSLPLPGARQKDRALTNPFNRAYLEFHALPQSHPDVISAEHGVLVALSDPLPCLFSQTISALSDGRASARKAAVGALLKCAAEHPAGPTAPWAVASLLGRMEDDSGEQHRNVSRPAMMRNVHSANLTLSLNCARAACVREAAVRGLVKVSERGNEAVVMAMASLIEEETAVTVKKAAVRIA